MAKSEAGDGAFGFDLGIHVRKYTEIGRKSVALQRR